MLKKLFDIFLPFRQIASELRAIRELYEAELADRDHPIFRHTERPHQSDTEVTYTGEEEKPKSALQRLKERFSAVELDEE
jgi:hypothetical protein